MTTTREALSEYLVAQNVAKAGDGPDQWYGDNWFYGSIFGAKIPVAPKFGYRGGLAAHDCHHMLNGFPTDWAGECETAVWELASGGCGRYVVYWFDRVFFLLLAPLVAPVRCFHAWRRGYGKKNLFRLDSKQLLAMNLDEVENYIS